MSDLDPNDLPELRAVVPSARGLWVALGASGLAIALAIAGYLAYQDMSRRDAATAFETANPIGHNERGALRGRIEAIRAAISADDEAIRGWFLSQDGLDVAATAPCARTLRDESPLVVITTRATLGEHTSIGYLPEGWVGETRLTDAEAVLARPVVGRGRYDRTMSSLEAFEPGDVVVIIADARADAQALTDSAFEGGYVHGDAVWFTASRANPTRRALCRAAVEAESSERFAHDPGRSLDAELAEDLRERVRRALEDATFFAVE